MNEAPLGSRSPSPTGSGGSPTPDQKAFKVQLEQFTYRKPADLSAPEVTPGKRRSPRLLTPTSSATGEALRSRESSRKRKPQDPVSNGFDGEHSTGSPAVVASSEEGESPSRIATQSLKKRRSTTKERSSRDPYNPVNKLVDSLRPGLILVFIGLNPGLTTAATGHAYAHRSNRFWPILHESGITPKRHQPSETWDLMDLYGIGNTNICARPTRSGDGLSKQELAEGAAILDVKIAEMKPEAVAIVGKGIWEAIWMAKRGQKRFNDPDFHWGWQDEELWLGRTKDEAGNILWKGARTFVATSTSGLAATLTPAEKLAIWKPLGEWVTSRREELETRDSQD